MNIEELKAELEAVKAERDDFKEAYAILFNKRSNRVRDTSDRVREALNALECPVEFIETAVSVILEHGCGELADAQFKIANLAAECDAMRARIEAAEKQEPVPAQQDVIPEFLMEMSQQMRTQDSRSTSHPFWQVRCHRYIPTEQGYNEHHWEIIGDEGVVYSSLDPIENFAAYLIENYPKFIIERNEHHDTDHMSDWLDVFIDGENIPYELRLIYVQEIEEVVSTHFTEHDALGFIERQQHNYPKLYTYVESAYWSPQIRKLQDWIISLTPDQTNDFESVNGG